MTLTITDANLKTVTLNEIPVSLTEGKLTISPAAGVQTVVATDQAGNSTSIAVTINDDHTWGDWVSNGDNTHTKTCSVDATHTKTADCHDGVATCEDLAVCDDCKQPYGELDPKNHTNLQHFPAKAATTTSKGNKEYWYCDGCGKYFSDEAGEKEITKAETVIAKLLKKSDSPKTGDDSNILLWLVLLFISGGALFTAVVFVVRKIADRKRKHTK